MLSNVCFKFYLATVDLIDFSSFMLIVVSVNILKEMIVPLLDAKQPKLVAAAVSMLKEIFHLYGTKTANPKCVFKSIPKLFAHSDKNVRAEVRSLNLNTIRFLNLIIYI